MSSERVEIRQTTVDKARRDAAAGVRREVVDIESKGLVLRVQPSGCVWQARVQHKGKPYRVTIGPVDLWPLAHARDAAREAREHVTSDHGVPDAYWMKALRERLVWEDDMRGRNARERAASPPPSRPLVRAREERVDTWTYRQARDAWGEHLASEAAAGNLTPETVRNYTAVVGCPAMREFDRRPVCRVTAADVDTVATDLAKDGKRSQARDVVRVSKRFYGWLARPAQAVRSGIVAGALDQIVAPRLGNVKGRQRFPELGRLGIVVATARSGALKPVIGAAVELLAWTSQRRLTIVRARRDEFMPWAGNPGWGKWAAGHRKTPGAKATGLPHSIPLPPSAWAQMQRYLAWLDEHVPDTEWAFPTRRVRRAGQEPKSGHIGADTLTHTLPCIPGAKMTPHDVRRCFSSSLVEAGHHLTFVGYVFDHASGDDSTRDENRMTRRYTEAEMMGFKRPVMETWGTILEPAAQGAVLLPGRELRAEIVRLRALRKGVDLAAEKIRMKGVNAKLWAEGRTTKQRKRAQRTV